ncbi:pre-rRNA-processing protein rix1 [Scheffersomyces spartinae]|uniref:Pre-rRNA-processing protein RIX1 n=1 Tax=Scheffersomyces spartinae TaxID=45513 RepID=A0A9P7V8E2_9ASCO|nr:pre-rRNA-processing protein rix1 [Scheffersomyces spartinae]KAG7192948.1 pre-rRNA-processing protein rix1 [Scheffersomyces spartinae]
MSYYPLSIVLKELEGPLSLVPLLRSLHHDHQLLKSASKSDLNHLVSRTLNLCRSPNPYLKWCGINVVYVICDDYTVLASEGTNLLGQLIKITESYNSTIDLKIFTSCIDAINKICDNIRGKPTLTREILTPKLPTIISLYLEKLHHQPLLVVNSLTKLITRHPTTYRTFGNKTKVKLLNMLSSSYTLPSDLRSAIMSTIAALPCIEKTEPEQVWESNVRDAIRELKSVIEIYGEFLIFEEDQDLKSLMEKLPRTDASQTMLLPALAIDVNEGLTLFQLSTRISILFELLTAYTTTETQFTVKVPIGQLITCIETVISISTKFLKFKGDVRDHTIKEIINCTLRTNHEAAMKFLSQLCRSYGGSILPFFNDILGFLEFVVPFKDNTINYLELLANELLYLTLLETVTTLLDLTDNLGDSSQLIRFVDMALILVEPRSEPEPTNKANTNANANGNFKKNKKKNNNSAALSDLLSHKNLFNNCIPPQTLQGVRRLFNVLIPKVNLPPTQHYKIIRYIIVEAVNTRSTNQEHKVSEDLIKLLECALLNPGFETVSILPIVSSILPQDSLISLFNSPRFPPLPQYVKQIPLEKEQDYEQDYEQDQPTLKRRTENETEDSSDDVIPDSKRAKIEPTEPVKTTVVEVNSELVFQPPDPNQVMLFATAETTEETSVPALVPASAPALVSASVPASVPAAVPVSVPATTAKPTPSQAVDINESDSDFEMPLLDGGDDSDEE